LPIEKVSREQYVKSVIHVCGSNGISEIDMALAEFKGRGYGSWDAKPPKKNYRIKFEKKQTLLGMPASRHWCLIAGVWNNKDGSLLKSDSAFTLTRAVFNRIEYAVRTRPIEVYINNQYHGVYTLSEKVHIEKKKIDISSQHNVLDTGYLLNYVWSEHIARTPAIARFKVNRLKKAPPDFYSNKYSAVHFLIKSPNARDIGIKNRVTQEGYKQQADFIRAKMQTFADTLLMLDYNQLKETADIPSFVDNLIVQELYKNADYGAGGCYIYRKPGLPHGDGKFYAGSPWDFDLTIDGEYDDWCVTQGEKSPNPFATYMFAMPEFKMEVKRRWNDVTADVKAFLEQFFNQYLDNTNYAYLFGRNFVHWDGKSQEKAETDWRKDTIYLKDWLINRANWFDKQWK